MTTFIKLSFLYQIERCIALLSHLSKSVLLPALLIILYNYVHTYVLCTANLYCCKFEWLIDRRSKELEKRDIFSKKNTSLHSILSPSKAQISIQQISTNQGRGRPQKTSEIFDIFTKKNPDLPILNCRYCISFLPLPPSN